MSIRKKSKTKLIVIFNKIRVPPNKDTGCCWNFLMPSPISLILKNLDILLKKIRNIKFNEIRDTIKYIMIYFLLYFTRKKRYPNGI